MLISDYIFSLFSVITELFIYFYRKTFKHYKKKGLKTTKVSDFSGGPVVRLCSQPRDQGSIPVGEDPAHVAQPEKRKKVCHNLIPQR